jgi:hypothetical protein
MPDFHIELRIVFFSVAILVTRTFLFSNKKLARRYENRRLACLRSDVPSAGGNRFTAAYRGQK